MAQNTLKCFNFCSPWAAHLIKLPVIKHNDYISCQHQYIQSYDSYVIEKSMVFVIKYNILHSVNKKAENTSLFVHQYWNPHMSFLL